MPWFCEEHGNNVGFSTFCNLCHCPVNVLLSRSMPHDDMCSCQTHENFISLTKALLPPYNRQWIVENAVCRFEEGSMLNQCATCKDGTKLKEALCKESKTLVTKSKCLDGRKQQFMID